MSTAGQQSDVELLRTYEPVLRYTRGELFFPTSVEGYVAQCCLWQGSPSSEGTVLARVGELDLQRLAEIGRYRRENLHLQFVNRPLTGKQLRRWRREERPHLSRSYRLASVALAARMVDALVRISLVLRGRVPGGAMAAAEIICRERLPIDVFPYYGRVVRDAGYVILQYWYFYAANDWRSSYAGVNDHEADWEMVSIYLVDGEHHQPVWAAYSSHDAIGDDLRRRWDDSELHRVGDHVVVYPGAGSHSGAFSPGDYVIGVEVPALRKALDRIGRAVSWVRPRRRGGDPDTHFAIPYVDYARGDGVSIGQAEARNWTPVLIDDETDWVRSYRGLWGLDTQDWLGGERAPAGPRYERSGTIRRSWSDPVGWAGLQKVSPAAAASVSLENEADLLGGLDQQITLTRARLRELDVGRRLLVGFADARQAARGHAAEVDRVERDLAEQVALRAAQADALDRYRTDSGLLLPPDPPRAHLRRPLQPAEQTRHSSVLSVWAAISTPLVVAAFLVLIFAPPLVFLTAAVLVLLVFGFTEAIARRRVRSYLHGVTVAGISIGLIVLGVVLFLRNWRLMTAIVLVPAASLLLLTNLRELSRSRAPTRKR